MHISAYTQPTHLAINQVGGLCEGGDMEFLVRSMVNPMVPIVTLFSWINFRDKEVIWENVGCLKSGEMVSLTGTHLGHNVPDANGNRYCINIVSISGYSD